MTLHRAAVIVPVFNGAGTIGACIESLLALTYPASAYEIIIVENGSTDATSDIVARYPVRLLHSAPGGAALARQRGVEATDADIIAFTDADCVVDPNWLSGLVAAFEDPEVGGAGGPILPRSSHVPQIPELFAERLPTHVNFASGPHEFLPHLYGANASYRRSLILIAGGFNPNLIVAEDVELCWRLQLTSGAKISHVESAIVRHRHRQTREDLGNQYRVYGFGEIVVDTLFAHHPNYPRSRSYQARRIAGQLAALPRYALSSMVRHVRLAFGRASEFDAAVPELWMLVEGQNIMGKIEAIIATRGMTRVNPGLKPARAPRLAGG